MSVWWRQSQSTSGLIWISYIPICIQGYSYVKDFRPISLIGSFYKIIAKILANRLIFVLGDIVNEVQSAFVADRQILDGSFILNELFQWSKSKKKQTMIFKVDFEKAFDSVRWDYLDDVLKKFDFGEKWCGWIQGCLRSSWGSIIVNGSPTDEFKFFKGMFKGVELGRSMQLSHMFYADDVIFVGQWNDSNIDTLVHVLDCFYRASADLEIDVSNEEIKKAVWDCGIDKSPGPDGFTFGSNSSFIALIPKTPGSNMVKDFRPISLIGSFYKIIAKILANHLIFILGDIVNEVQSAFVANRQILDCPFILNELFQWSKSKKKQTMIFKVDFEKAFDSVRWDYLDDVLKKFDFGEKWCGWIQVHVLDCFYRASGLRISMCKSKLMGISVGEERVNQAASKIGCLTLKVPFSYLGTKVGYHVSYSLMERDY
nr:RNA-directed DNA polymerase, eukaryota, reverse transcriptase zinc-binding domain protein [Tanacetum cinerariifolium]